MDTLTDKVDTLTDDSNAKHFADDYLQLHGSRARRTGLTMLDAHTILCRVPLQRPACTPA